MRGDVTIKKKKKKNRSLLYAKLLVDKKRGFRVTARVALIKDLEYLVHGTVNNMCWPYIRNFVSAIG